MTAVLELGLVLRPASAMGPVAAFRNQALQPHVAGCPAVWPDLALLEGVNEDAVWPTAKEPGQISFAHRERDSNVEKVTMQYLDRQQRSGGLELSSQRGQSDDDALVGSQLE